MAEQKGARKASAPRTSERSSPQKELPAQGEGHGGDGGLAGAGEKKWEAFCSGGLEGCHQATRAPAGGNRS